MKRAVLYGRVSSNDLSKTGGANLADQLRLCREYAQKNGYHIVEELAEDARGVSGADMDAPELQRAIDMAFDGQFDVMIVREMDRLARDAVKMAVTQSELKRAGVKIEYALYDFDDSAEGRLMRNQLAALAEYERAKITERMARGKRRAIREGNVNTGGHGLFGYAEVERDGRRTLAIIDDEAEVVRLIFQLYIVGDVDRGPLSIRAIAKHLTAQGIPTYTDRRKTALGAIEKTVREYGHWPPSTVSRMLANETYAGRWIYADEITVNVPAIIGEAVWEAAQKRKRRNRQFSLRNTKREYLLLHRVRCGGCGRVMIAHSKPRHNYYECGHTANLAPCPLHVVFNAADVDRAAWVWLHELLADPEKLRRGLREYQEHQRELTRPQRQELKIVETEIQSTEAKSTKALDLYLDDAVSRGEFDQRRTKYEKKLINLRERRQRLLEIVAERELTDEQLATLTAWAAEVAPGLAASDDDFEKRRRVVDMLDVTGELTTEDGQKVAYLHCVLGDSGPLFASKNTSGPHSDPEGNRSRIRTAPAPGRPGAAGSPQ